MGRSTNFAQLGVEPIFLAVVGGTRRYENVVGQLKVGEEMRPGTLKVAFELLPSFRRP